MEAVALNPVTTVLMGRWLQRHTHTGKLHRDRDGREASSSPATSGPQKLEEARRTLSRSLRGSLAAQGQCGRRGLALAYRGLGTFRVFPAGWGLSPW